MKGFMKRSLSLLLLSTVVFSTACKPKQPEKGQEEIVVPEDNHEYTETLLAKNGETDYTVVIPENASEYETFASEELVTLFREATGATLPVVTDEAVEYSETAKYISISDTTLLEKSGVETDYAKLGRSGAKVVTKGDVVLLAGATDESALYATYDFLGELFDYEYYDVDAYTLNKKKTAYLPVLDITDVPDMDLRMYGECLQEQSSGGDIHNAWRQRFVTSSQGVTNGAGGHMVESVMPYSIYGAEHPEWYSGDRLQLCYCNDEAREKLAELLKEKLTADPTSTVTGLGQADYNTWCSCEKCTAMIEKYGNGQKTTMGAITQILFVNKLVDELDAWLEENFPGRKMTYNVYAYHQTVTAPAHKDASGKYIPNGSENGDYSMVYRPNVNVQYASIYANRNLNFKENPSECENIKAWSACAKGFYIYDYPQDARNVCLPYDRLHVATDNIRFAKECGLTSYKYQGNYNTMSSGFNYLGMYVISKIMWDIRTPFATAEFIPTSTVTGILSKKFTA